MKEIPVVNQTRCIKVDDEDYERLAAFKWYIRSSPTGDVIYRRTKNAESTLILRREIFGSDCRRLEHINGDPYDCRKENLRGMYAAQNADNRKYNGVWYDKSGTCAERHWRAQIRVDGKRYFLGWHATFEAARAARMAAERLHYNEQMIDKSANGTNKE